MKRALAILLLGATTAFGQIDNPPTSTSILDATTVGRAVLTASNAAAARSAIEVTLTNLSSTPTLTALTNTGNSVLGTNSTNTVTVGGNLLVGGSIAVTNAATTRTNLGLGATNSPQFTSIIVGAPDQDSIGISAGEITTGSGGISFDPQQLINNWEISGAISWSSNSFAATTRTNLGLPLPALTNTSNVTTMRALAGSTNTNQPFSGSIALTNTNTLVFSNGILLSQ
jgi:hypothetical protein